MKVGVRAQSIKDAVAIATGIAPQPVFDTLLAAGLAQTVTVGSNVGLFDALAAGPMDAASLARSCGTAPQATELLANALTSSGYLRRVGAGYALTAMARRWMLGSSRFPLGDTMSMMRLVWKWLEHYEEFVRTGRPLDVHASMEPPEWAVYMRGMESMSRLCVPEFILRTPVPSGATRMIDVGGAHGLYSASLCNKHPSLVAEVHDLPEALEVAEPLLARHGLGDRLRGTPGDLRTTDFGEHRYDLALVSNVVHHFDAATNRSLIGRLAAALKPGGVLVVQEPFAGLARRGDQIGGLGALYFASLSQSRTWSTADVRGWMLDAGLATIAARTFVSVPGFAQVTAARRARR